MTEEAFVRIASATMKVSIPNGLVPKPSITCVPPVSSALAFLVLFFQVAPNQFHKRRAAFPAPTTMAAVGDALLRPHQPIHGVMVLNGTSTIGTKLVPVVIHN